MKSEHTHRHAMGFPMFTQAAVVGWALCGSPARCTVDGHLKSVLTRVIPAGAVSTSGLTDDDP